jgi:predicted deacylase
MMHPLPDAGNETMDRVDRRGRSMRRLHLVVGILSALCACDAAGATPDPGRESDWGDFSILGSAVAPGERRRIWLPVSESFSGADLRTPVFIVRGTASGPSLCVTAGVHGDEVNGVEVVRRLLQRVEPEELRGMLVAVPIVNLSAVRRGSRYLPDRRDLNRYFPGRPTGSAASRIAHAFFEGVVRHCSALVDVHTGSFHRKNLHQVRADLSKPRVLELAQWLGAGVVVHNSGREGTLRRAAGDAGIPAVTVEAGEPARFDEAEVERGVEGLERLLSSAGMREGPSLLTRQTQRIYRRSSWIRADDGGILVSRVALGEDVLPGQILGSVSDPLSDEVSRIRSPYAGQVIGIAFDQLVMPGFAAYHLGLADEAIPAFELETPSDAEPDATDEADALDLDERPE